MPSENSLTTLLTIRISHEGEPVDWEDTLLQSVREFAQASSRIGIACDLTEVVVESQLVNPAG